jgi:hypothetical protein
VDDEPARLHSFTIKGERMLDDIMRQMLAAIADRHKLSFELMREFLDTAFIAAKVNMPNPKISDDEYKKHDAFLAKLGELERKARRYDLLIGEEKAKAEEMAGK